MTSDVVGVCVRPVPQARQCALRAPLLIMMADDLRLEAVTGSQKTDEDRDEDHTQQVRRYGGLVSLGVVGVLAVAINVVAFPFLTPALRRLGVPFIPATHNQLACVLRHLKKESGKAYPSMVDLGSGDGRVVIAAAQRGVQSVGYELNFWLVLYSRARAFWRGVGHLTAFKRQDMWKADLSNFDNVVVFGVEEIMNLMEKKIVSEVSSGTRVIVSRFKFPTLEHYKQLETGSGLLWVYQL